MDYIKTAVLFCAGIYLSERLAPEPAVIFIISLIMVLTVKAVFKHCFNIKILFAVLVFVTGMGVCRYAKNDANCDLYEYSGKYVTAEGRISELPSEKDGNVHYIVDVHNVSHNGDKTDVRARVILTAQAGHRYGDSISFEGFIEPLPEKMNENGFDYSVYYKSKNIFYKIYSDDAEISMQTFHDYSPYALANHVRSFISGVIDEHYEGDYAAIMKAVLTGNKKEFSEEFSKVLTRTGTSRFFYPAYIHTALFLTVIAFVLSIFKKRTRDILTVFLLIIYAMMNLSGTVFIKLCGLTAVTIILRLRHGHVYFFDALGLTAIIIGLISPLIYFNAGFAMSMLSSVLIYYFFDYVNKKLSFIKIKYIRRMLSIGIICTIGLLPMSAYFFHSVTPAQAVLSIIMLPCVSVIIILSPILIAMLSLFGSAPVVGQAVSAVLFALKHIPYLLDKAGITKIALPEPSLLFLIIYMLIITACVKYVKNKKRDMKKVLFAVSALTVSLLINQAVRLNETEITFVNVGQGDGAVITAPYRYNILIDGGGGSAYSDYNAGEKIFLEYLLSEGITYIDSAFVSHFHKDHVQGIIAAVENIRVRNLFMPDNMEGSEWRVKLEQAARKNNTIIHYISEETLLTYNNGMTLKIVPPPDKVSVSTDENDTSYMYRIEYGDFSAVFTGDMTAFSERALIETGKACQADLLKIAHHGSKTSTSREWLEAVKPYYAVISAGKNNTYALPNKEVLSRLADTRLYRTDLDGDIHFTVNKNGNADIRTRR